VVGLLLSAGSIVLATRGISIGDVGDAIGTS
jgi:hypothetical protein